MDVNNQMILMRKDIKRAKVHVVSKLVRHIKNLRGKRGTDSQKQKNSNRADRLAQEIQVLKELKSDFIFKFLLTSELSLEELSKKNEVSLQSRACVRIGMVHFINMKIKNIREEVSSFDATRSNKESVSSLKIARELESVEHKSKRLKLSHFEDDHGLNQITGVLPAANVPVDSSLHTDHDELRNANSLKDSNVLEEPKNISDKSENLVLNVCRTQTMLPDKSANDISGEDISTTNTESETESVDDEPSEPKYMVPATNQTEFEENLQTRHIDFSVITETNDVSEILVNIGKGYAGSDEESTSATHKQSDEKAANWDPFFMDSNAPAQTESYRETSIGDKGDRIVKDHTSNSVFLSSLSEDPTMLPKRKRKSDMLNRKKGGRKKNRLGQRARKNLYGSDPNKSTENSQKQKKHQDQDMGFHNKKFERTNKQFGNGSKSNSDATRPKGGDDNRNLHPSWQASQVRKQQIAIQEFKGKRITFDDSD